MKIDYIGIQISKPTPQFAAALLHSISHEQTAQPARLMDFISGTPAATAQFPRIGEPWPGLPGSAYAGVARGLDGEADGHLVLLADKPTDDLAWQAAIDWAKALGDGARLPTRFESALLYANLQDHFDTDRYHWTGSQFSAGSAWNQGFNDGGQLSNVKSYEARARAVRRFTA